MRIKPATPGDPTSAGNLHAEFVYFDDRRIMHVRLSDGREILAPLDNFPRLRHATDDQLTSWELVGRGIGIHWEELDEDLSVAGLLRDAVE